MSPYTAGEYLKTRGGGGGEGGDVQNKDVTLGVVLDLLLYFSPLRIRSKQKNLFFRTCVWTKIHVVINAI